jgi:hypothetical protein
MTYLTLREQEAKRPGRPKHRGPRSRRLEEIVDGIEGISDQAVLRQAREGKDLSTRSSASAFSQGLAPQETQLIRKLVARLQDNDFPADFRLMHRNGRVKMEMASGLDLVFPEELLLLGRLSGAASS